MKLLNVTLSSIAQQTDNRFHCLIACHDIPPVQERYKDFITFLQVDAPIPQNITEMRKDKGLKKQYIGAHFRTLGGGYLMFLDSDDLVHRSLVEHVLKHDDPNGYIVREGFEYNSQTKRLMHRNGFNHICGSCGIFRLAPEDLPQNIEDRDCFYSQLQSHKLFEQVCSDHGRPLQPIPFPAVVYLRTPDITISTRFFKATGLRLWKQNIREMMLGRKLTPEIRQDFYLLA